MLQVVMTSKAVKIIYGIIFPVTVVSLLLGVATFNNRPRFLGSTGADIIIRIMLVVWFCGLYIRLSRFTSFSFFTNKKWSKSDMGREKYIYIVIILLFCIGIGLITWWVTQWFLPNFSSLKILLAILNSIIVFLPMVSQYWLLKL